MKLPEFYIPPLNEILYPSIHNIFNKYRKERGLLKIGRYITHTSYDFCAALYVDYDEETVLDGFMTFPIDVKWNGRTFIDLLYERDGKKFP